MFGTSPILLPPARLPPANAHIPAPAAFLHQASAIPDGIVEAAEQYGTASKSSDRPLEIESQR